MIRALALISASFIVFFSTLAVSAEDLFGNSRGKNYGLRADLCFDKHAPTCHSFYLQNRSNAVVEKTTIRTRTSLEDENGNEVCRRGKDEVVRTNLSGNDRFRARLDTRCAYYIRFRLGTCDGNNDKTFSAKELSDAFNDFKDPTIALRGKCDVYIEIDEVWT